MASPREVLRIVHSHLRSAAEHFEAGRHDLALAEIDAVLQLDPSSTPALEMRARIREARQPAARMPPSRAADEGEAEAIPSAEAVAAQWQGFEERMRARAAVHRARATEEALAGGRLETARALVEELQRLDPAHPELAILKGRLERRGSAPAPGAPSAAWPPPVGAGERRPQGRTSTGGSGWRAAIALAVLGVTAHLLLGLSGGDDPGPPSGGTVLADRGREVVLVDAAALARMPPGEASAGPAAAPLPEGDDAVDPSPPAPVVRPEPARAAPAPVRTARGSVAPAVAEPVRVSEFETPAEPRSARTSSEALPVAEVTPAAAVPSSPLVRTPAFDPRAAVPREEAATRPGATEEVAVRQTLGLYETAYSRLDAAAARAIWPAVDYRALNRAFQGLESQRVVLERCFVDVEGDRARASCSGRTTFVPRVGSRGEQTRIGRWTFALTRADENWRIEGVEAR